MRRLFAMIISGVMLMMLNVTNIYADDVKWDYDNLTHTLIVNQGDIGNYDISEQTPWFKWKDDITTVVVRPGVTAIGNNAFAKFSKLAFVSLPDGLLTIGENAFAETDVEQLVIPASVTSIGASAFLWCDKLRTIYLGGSITQLGSKGTSEQDYGAFAYCNAVSDIYFYQQDLSSISWNNTWEFKDNQATKIHVYESASKPTGLNCSFVNDIGDDLRGLGQGDMSNPDKPYEIYYNWQLDFITAMINSAAFDGPDENGGIYLKLMDDLVYDKTENNFTPIGTDYRSFKGVFDGNGHKISGININSNKNYAGIIPYVNGTVKNVKFDDIHIQTTGSLAGVIGALSNSTIENITIENSSFQADNVVGALVGYIEDGAGTTVSNCHAKSTVTVKSTNKTNVDSFAGGLVGRASGGSISGCSSAAVVSGLGQYVAGLVGCNRISLADCIYLGSSVTSGKYGCAVSDNIGTTYSVSNCFYTNASLTDSQAQLAYALTLGDDVKLANETVKAYGTTGQFPGITSYSGLLHYDGIYYAQQGTSLTFGDQNAWYVVNDECVRTYTIQMPGKATRVTLFAFTGKGTESEPYLISNINDMDFLAKTVNGGNSLEGKFVELAADLVYDESKNNYIPVGEDLNSSWHLFEGVFNGKGHTISGIYVEKTGNYPDSRSRYNGIFGAVGPNGVVKNLVGEKNTFTGHYTGGIAGYNMGVIENCLVRPSVVLKAAWSHSYTDGTKLGTYYIGGIVGNQPREGYGAVSNDGPAIIRGCVSYAYIDNDGHHTCKDFGGIIGYNSRSTPNIQHCLYLGNHVNVGTDLGGESAGAIAGRTIQTTGYVTNSYYIDNTLVGDYGNSFPLAHQLDIDEGFEIDSEKTVYGEGDYVGITAYENGVLCYDGVNYAPEGLKITFKVSGTLAEGVELLGMAISPYSQGDVGGATSDGLTLTMGSADIKVKAVLRNAIDKDNWISHRSASFSDISETDKLLVIKSSSELARFAYEVNVLGKTFEGWTVKLADDVDLEMSTYSWEPVGSIAMPNNERLFRGTFDGNRRVISGIKAFVNDHSEGLSYNYIGLFSVLPAEAAVKDLFMSLAKVTGAHNVGVVAGENNGTVTNCHVYQSSVTAMAVNADCFGGVVGKNSGGSITYCSVNKTTISDGNGFMSASHFGGICGSNLTKTDNMDSDNGSQQPKEAVVDNNLFFGGIKVSGTAPLGYYGVITGENKAQANNNYYDASATVTVINKVPATYEGDGAHDYDTSLGLGVGQPSTNEKLSYSSVDVEGVAEPLAVDGRDNTKALNLLLTRDQHFDQPNVKYDSNHPFTLKGRIWYRDGEWNTICLPFDFALTYSTPLRTSNIKQLKGSAYDANTHTLTLYFEDVADYMIKAGTPFIVRSIDKEDDVVDPVFDDVTVVTAETQDVETEYITFKGIFSPVVFEKGNEDRSALYLGSGNKLYYPSGETDLSINAFRAYFQMNGITAGDPVNGINNFKLDFGDESTGIEDVTNNHPQTSDSNTWYTLDGRKLNGKPATKGVYIHNGKTLIIK